MKKEHIGFIGGLGFCLGWFIVSLFFSSPPKDCAITLADGVSGGTLSGFKLQGHKFGICIGSKVSNVRFTNLNFQDIDTIYMEGE